MRFPELLYTPAPFDVAKSIVLPQRVAQSVTNTVAAVRIDQRLDGIPKDQALVVTNISLLGVGSGAQLVIGLRAAITGADPSINEVSYICRFEAQTHVASNRPRMHGNWSGEVIVMPGESVLFTADYDAGALGNVFQASYAGYLVPRASLQHGQLNFGLD